MGAGRQTHLIDAVTQHWLASPVPDTVLADLAAAYPRVVTHRTVAKAFRLTLGARTTSENSGAPPLFFALTLRRSTSLSRRGQDSFESTWRMSRCRVRTLRGADAGRVSESVAAAPLTGCVATGYGR